MHVFHAASSAYRPDLLLTKLIGKDWLLKGDVMENWGKNGALNKFEGTQVYAYLYKGK